ncbi:histidine--tRNA ligase [Hippea maritima]|uniref:Histidine--tRNA ligase n=1 Tax=Hippea maritima (strain ATCC 700847 / DSM 10411 / MH2) TaxID=760142 RepID=F2LU03_HIPMA|nr:histidine--tRNA ligase [Hippea maritima]AEA33402.1 Histidyl-tRNA synthetase [Hippea maritima DSM 10411]
MEILRGFKDILPQDIKKWQKLEKVARETLESFGYKEIRTPILEKTSLFARSVGETTDIVEKEMYIFLDKSGESVTLRPEGTAGTVRAFIDNHLENYPFKKYYYIGPMFRYERPQKGRLRQFHQIGIEVFGIDNPAVDAEVVLVDKIMLDKLNISDLRIEINNIGCPDCRPEYSKRLKEYFQLHKGELCDDCRRRLDRNPLRILDCKNNTCSQIAKGAPKIIEFVCDSCKNHYEKVKNNLTALGIEFEENPHLVRGLDYYTKFVFEIITDKLGAQGTVSAGGRYDNLVEQLGGKPTSGIGFASGCERLINLMDEDETQGIDYYIANLDEDVYAMDIARKLSLTGRSVYVEYESRSLKSMLKKADKMNARFVVIVGENEKNKGIIIVKDMEDSTQEEKQVNKFIEDEVARWQ